MYDMQYVTLTCISGLHKSSRNLSLQMSLEEARNNSLTLFSVSVFNEMK